MKPRDPEKERALFEATLRVADREGLETLTVQKVAREAGLAVGTLYVYFEGKEDLLRRLYLRSKAAAGARMFQGYSPDLPFRQAFRLLCRNHFQFLVENRRDVRFQAQFYRSGFADVPTRTEARAALAAAEALVRRGQREDLVRAWEPALVLRFVLSVLKEAAAEAEGKGPEAAAELVERATEFCLAGIAV